jgi:XTP/dITP diphosphohydrolase
MRLNPERSPVLCSHNLHKLEEMSELLDIDLKPIGHRVELPDETGETFEANARIKALAGHRWFPDRWAIADDSGLEVDALDGAPGVRSARFAGDDATDSANNELLLRRLAGEQQRAARFVCVLVAVGPGGEELVARGTVEGAIATELRGAGGFGYDPLFVPDGYDDTFGVLGSAVKARISHRANACRTLQALLVAS